MEQIRGSHCTNGLGYTTDHEAEGWITAPDGRRIVRQCQPCAQDAIDEYREKLGEEWGFEPFEADPCPGCDGTRPHPMDPEGDCDACT